MRPDREALREVAEKTVVIRPPRQHLATFGVTTVDYYLVTSPSYQDPDAQPTETVVREGQLNVQRPQIVTPFYLLNLFQGFEHGAAYAENLAETHGAQSPGLLYSYRHDLRDTSIVSDPPDAVVRRIVGMLDDEGKALAAVVFGVDHLWDVSLMKFAFDLTVGSVGQNVQEMASRGLFQMRHGVPQAGHVRIAELFDGVRAGEVAPSDLKAEIDRWGLWDEYQDRFFDLFRKRG